MTKILYRFFNGRWVDRLITQHWFEGFASSPEGLRLARARVAQRRLHEIADNEARITNVKGI